MIGKSENFIVVMRMWKKWPVGLGLMLMGTLAITPLSIALETAQPSVPKEETDIKPLQEGSIGSGISENLNPWEIEWDKSNDYEYPLEPDSNQTKPTFAPNYSDHNWLDDDTNNLRQRSGTVPFLRF
ncbi:MAG: hypothetical protein QNJ64_01175 [Crocosphaera sp.]|nr:hypothetical protein [Crocosphaera sp.]